MLSRTERVEMNRLKGDFDSLKKQYVAISESKRNSTDSGVSIQLDGQLKTLRQKMETTDQQLKDFQRDSLEPDSQRLLEILQSGGQVVENRVLLLYQQEGYTYNSNDLHPETLEDVLIELKDLPTGDLEYSLLERMIAQLMQDGTIPQPIRQQLRTWLRSKVSNFPKLENEVRQVTPAIHYFLIVRVKRDGGQKYAVSAWLMPQTLSVNALPPEDWGSGIDPMVLDTIPELIQTWVQRSVTQVGEAKQITVQVFLPKDHLNTAIEQWEVNTQGTAVWLGVECKAVVVRCENRLSKLRQDVAYITRWRNRWEKLTEDSQSNCEELLALGDCDNAEMWKALYLSLSKAEKVGCYFTQSPHAEMLDRMIDMASPVLLWQRARLPHCMPQWQSLLSRRIADLPYIVTQERENAWRSTLPDLHLGSHLALLWDDPHHLPPDVDVEFSHIQP